MKITLCLMILSPLVLAGNSGPAYGQGFLTNGLVSYYPFAGNADDVAGTNDGTPMGATLTTDRFGNANSAYLFDGSGWISTLQTRLLDGASNATITAWALTAGSGKQQLLAAGDSRDGLDPISLILEPQLAYGVWFQNCLPGNNSLSNTIGEGSTHGHHTLTNFTADTWHQLDFVLSTSNPLGTFTIYVDGVTNYSQIASDDGTTPFAKISYDTNMPFLIGALNNQPPTGSTPIDLWLGRIDDVRIYNRAFSPQEIQLLYEYESRSPQIITNDGSFGILSNQFGFNVSGAYGATIVVDGSSNMLDWVPLLTNTVTGNPFYFSDPASTNDPGRFYRARLP
jgi:hypothetical protein